MTKSPSIWNHKLGFVIIMNVHTVRNPKRSKEIIFFPRKSEWNKYSSKLTPKMSLLFGADTQLQWKVMIKQNEHVFMSLFMINSYPHFYFMSSTSPALRMSIRKTQNSNDSSKPTSCGDNYIDVARNNPWVWFKCYHTKYCYDRQ